MCVLKNEYNSSMQMKNDTKLLLINSRRNRKFDLNKLRKKIMFGNNPFTFFYVKEKVHSSLIMTFQKIISYTKTSEQIMFEIEPFTRSNPCSVKEKAHSSLIPLGLLTTVTNLPTPAFVTRPTRLGVSPKNQNQNQNKNFNFNFYISYQLAILVVVHVTH